MQWAVPSAQCCKCRHQSAPSSPLFAPPHIPCAPPTPCPLLQAMERSAASGGPARSLWGEAAEAVAVKCDLLGGMNMW